MVSGRRLPDGSGFPAEFLPGSGLNGPAAGRVVFLRRKGEAARLTFRNHRWPLRVRLLE